MILRKITLFLLILLYTGCSAHISPLQMPEGQQVLYITDDEERVFSAARTALTGEVGDAPIIDLVGPIRGYSVRYKLGLDYKDFMVRVYPAKGNADGVEVRGYYVEVSTDGTMMNGSASAKRLYDNINQRLASFARAISVTGIVQGKYNSEMDAFRLNERPSLRDGGTINVVGTSSMADEIKKLNELKQQGIITQTEYEQGKRKILDNK